MLAQMPALDLLLAGIQHPFVVRLLLGWGVKAAIDAGVEGPAEGLAYALLVRGGLVLVEERELGIGRWRWDEGR